jgi:hypothetical protein
MNTLIEVTSPVALNVEVTDENLRVDLSDGRSITVPLSWYPRLSQALPRHRNQWKLQGGGHGIHWPFLDEDISVENILFGKPSGESSKSFAQWQQWYRGECEALG